MVPYGMLRATIAVLLAFTSSAIAEQARGPMPPSVAVCFVPEENCESRVVDAIATAKKQILVQAYGFSDPPIIEALVAAAARGVEVLVILDKSNDHGKAGPERMIAADIPVWIDVTKGIAHSKVMVIDGEITLTGSYNFTRSAQTRNAENLLTIVSRPVAQRFKANWDARLKVAKAYEGATSAKSPVQ